MTIHRWGAGQTERENLPMLSEWLEEHPSQSGKEFQVIKVSKSQRYGSFTFQCAVEGGKGFRVNVYENSPVHDVLTAHFKEWRENKQPVYVVVTDEEWGHWEIATGDEPRCEWVKNGTTFICSLVAGNKS